MNARKIKHNLAFVALAGMTLFGAYQFDKYLDLLSIKKKARLNVSKVQESYSKGLNQLLQLADENHNGMIDSWEKLLMHEAASLNENDELTSTSVQFIGNVNLAIDRYKGVKE
ncbi:MAG: hypothetical protein Q7S56_00640 [Nanoarchaeota archaeon]|nr:hypothetical protein [Nanoarchaeota archaeon]